MLAEGQVPKDPSHQSWLSTVGQQLVLDDYGILYRWCPDQQKPVIYMPDIAREAVVREAHVLPVGSHLSLQKTLARLKKHFYWPQMASHCHKYCNSCVVCAGRKGQGRQVKAELKSIKSPKKPLEFVMIDILKLPEMDDTHTRA